MKVEVQFTYDEKKNKTTVYIIHKMKIVEKFTVDGNLHQFQRKKVKEEVDKEYKGK